MSAPSTSKGYDIPGILQIHHWAWISATFFGSLAVFTSIFIIYKHLKYYTDPKVQKYVVRIILMIPIYTIDSLISLYVHKLALYFNVMRDCYEAYVLYMFFRVLIELAGGEEELISGLNEVPQMKYSFPLCCFHIKPGRTFMHRCKQMILQFVIVKPVLAIITFILELVHLYDEGYFGPDRGYLWITIFYNASITVSLYFLVLFYEGTKEILAPYKPIAKFLCIKAVIFFAFWQGVVVAAMSHFKFILKANEDWTLAEVSMGVQNWLICIEMFPVSLAYMKYFGYKAFKDPSFNSGPREGDSKMTIVSNFVSVMNVRDVLHDSRVALKKGVKKDIKELADFLALPKETQQSLMIYQGYLEKKGEDIAKLWKRRFFIVLKEPSGIIIYEDDPFGIEFMNKHLKPSGWIDFKTVTAVEAKYTKCFNVVTPQRTWRLRCRSPDDRPQWMNLIIATCRLKGSTIEATTSNEDLEKGHVPLDDQD